MTPFELARERIMAIPNKGKRRRMLKDLAKEVRKLALEVERQARLRVPTQTIVAPQVRR